MKQQSGFTLVEILIVIAIIGILAAIAIPAFRTALASRDQNTCIGNLKDIDDAKSKAAGVFNLTAGDSCATASVNTCIKDLKTPACPAGGIYVYGNIGSAPTCTISTPVAHQLPAAGSL